MQNQFICRIGMTTDMAGREAYWRGRFPTMSAFEEIAGPFLTYREAQAEETQRARLEGCESYPGGRPGIGPWYVYRFEY